MSSAYEQVTEVAGYRLAERIGSGGMGEVYKAYNASLNRYAAVKILFQETFAERFKNEAYIQASVNHPNIARLYEYTSIADKHCIVMEYVEGECLDLLVKRRGKLSSAETENIIRQIVSALAYLHKMDIMHRDIKPQNFKVQVDGTVKMLDFGIAKNKYSPKLTQAGFVVGTMEYLAPEQFDQQAGIKSDIWALAVLTYELVTGYMPFESPNIVLLKEKIRKGSFTDPSILIPDISEKLLLVLDKSLKVNPTTRISAAGIENILGKQHKPADNAKQFRFSSKTTAIAAGVVLILLLSMLLINKNDEPKINPEESIQLNETKKETGAGLLTRESSNKILINTPGIENAQLVLNNGETKQLPYSIEGKEGDKFEFTIRADGYKDKKVEVQISPRRSSFEYNLDKLNN